MSRGKRRLRASELRIYDSAHTISRASARAIESFMPAFLLYHALTIYSDDATPRASNGLPPSDFLEEQAPHYLLKR